MDRKRVSYLEVEMLVGVPEPVSEVGEEMEVSDKLSEVESQCFTFKHLTWRWRWGCWNHCRRQGRR